MACKYCGKQIEESASACVPCAIKAARPEKVYKAPLPAPSENWRVDRRYL